MRIVVEVMRHLDSEVTSGQTACLPVMVINQRQARDVAKTSEDLATTDANDVLVVARFAESVQPPLRPLPCRRR